MKTIELKISDLDWKILQHGDIDPEGWLQNTVRIRIKNIRARIVKEEQARLVADPTTDSMPATTEGILESHFGQEGYMNGAEKYASSLDTSEVP